jgi:hypothetical protein
MWLTGFTPERGTRHGTPPRGAKAALVVLERRYRRPKRALVVLGESAGEAADGRSVDIQPGTRPK